MRGPSRWSGVEGIEVDLTRGTGRFRVANTGRVMREKKGGAPADSGRRPRQEFPRRSGRSSGTGLPTASRDAPPPSFDSTPTGGARRPGAFGAHRPPIPLLFSGSGVSEMHYRRSGPRRPGVSPAAPLGSQG